MDSVREVTDLDKLKSQIAELEEQSGAPDLWDDPEHAQEVTSRLSRANSELERVTGMYERIDDLEVLVELGEEEDDADTMAEAERELASVRKAVGELEVRTLLSGEYDEREAVVTIRSGAGGVDAADFAEMLMRMYLRWAERHGYPTEVSTPPTPRRPGSSRRPSRSTRPTPTARCRSRPAPTGWCGSARSTTRAAARRRSPRSR